MDALKIQLVGSKELLAKLDKVGGGWAAAQGKMASQASFVAERELKLALSTGPLHARSNIAEKATHAFVEMFGSGFRAGARNNTFYLEGHETGLIIVPRNKEYLHFMTDDGKWVRVKQVRLPARKPGKHAARKSEPVIRRLWTRTIEGLVGK